MHLAGQRHVRQAPAKVEEHRDGGADRTGGIGHKGDGFGAEIRCDSSRQRPLEICHERQTHCQSVRDRTRHAPHVSGLSAVILDSRTRSHGAGTQTGYRVLTIVREWLFVNQQRAPVKGAKARSWPRNQAKRLYQTKSKLRFRGGTVSV
ncbi:hypothetical protein NITMOv2_1389 [Nitrospira moscoviensis]|uniref:Uncharacterized protein n=1 Tax=Nitrospira moscoviensis TaxID=42253 RepID=A0A0K2GA15_NITMO|nr:hypothetical protein NITMOv2_1389 [Nitrospira moscoviensis]